MLRLIGEDGEQLGVMETRKAIAMARERELEVVVVSDPPSTTLLNQEASSGETLVGMNQKIGESSQPYETLYKGS